jgi:hypothetical protein
VREDVDRRHFEDRSEPDRRLQVVAEREERRAERAELREREAVQNGRHRVLPDAEMHVAPARRRPTEIAGAFERETSLGRRCEICGAADEPRYVARDRVLNFRGGFSTPEALRVGLERRQVAVPAAGQVAPLHPIELVRELRVIASIAGQHRRPRLAELTAACADAATEVIDDAVGHEELRVLGPTIGPLGEPDLLLTERLTVSGVRVVLVRRSPADVAVDDDESRAIGAGLERLERAVEQIEIVRVTDADDVPSICEKTPGDVLREREIGASLDRDPVVVVDPAEVREPQVPSERSGLAGYPFHQAPIAAERVDVVGEERVVGAVVTRGEPASRDSHSHARRDALPERTRRRLDAGSPVVLRMSRALAVELAETADVVERDRQRAERLVLGVHRFHADEMQHRIEKHRGMSHRQHESVAIRPDRVVRIEAQPSLPKRVGDRRHRHRRPGMSRVRLLHGVHGESANGVDAERVE